MLQQCRKDDKLTNFLLPWFFRCAVLSSQQSEHHRKPLLKIQVIVNLITFDARKAWQKRAALKKIKSIIKMTAAPILIKKFIF